MNRKEAAELSPFIKAFGEGKDIEMRSKNPHAQLNGWAKMDEFIFGNFEYRIKPETKYRPFKNAEECWQEMLKHDEFGWVKSKTRDANKHISNIEKDIEGNIWFVAASFSGIEKYSPKQMLDYFVFMDGEPFGIKEE